MKLANLMFGALVAVIPAMALAQNVTLTVATGQPASPGDMSIRHMAEISAAEGIASLQIQSGLVLTKTIQQVAQRDTDMSYAPFALPFLMSKGLGPYSALGADGGAELADSLRILIPFHVSSYYLRAFANSGIDSWDDLAGKTLHNGPPSGGALVMARQMMQAVTGLAEGEDYTGAQIDWGQQNSIFLDGSVDASLIPGTNPDANMPMLVAAGKINLISVPKDIFEGEAFQRLVGTPGRVSVQEDLSTFDHYGDDVNAISEDSAFRTAGEAGGLFVNAAMDKELARALTASFLETLPDLYRKVPYAESQKIGVIEEAVMGVCRAGLKLHEGAVEAYEQAGYTVEECQKP